MSRKIIGAICLLSLGASLSAFAYEPDPCATYRVTKQQLAEQVAELNQTNSALEAKKEELNKAYNQAIYSGSALVATSTILFIGKKTFGEQFIAQIKSGKISPATAGYAVVFAAAAGGSVAWLLTSTKDIIVLSNAISALKAEKETALSAKKELQKAVDDLMVRNGCGA